MKNHLSCFAAVLSIVASTAANAEDGNLSFGLDALAGISGDDSQLTGPDDSETLAALPSLAFGGDKFVVQVDGMLADHRDDTVAGGAVHVGAHVNPTSYVGVYGSHSENNRHSGLGVYRAGGEVEFDLGKLGLASVAGYEHATAGSFLIRTTSTDTIYDVYRGGGRFFAFSDVRFMPTDRVRISVGHRYTGGRHALALGAGFGLTGNLALVAEGRIGQGDNKIGLIGLRMRFGGGEGGPSLLDNRLAEDLMTPANGRDTLGVPLPPPDEEPNCGSCGGYCQA